MSINERIQSRVQYLNLDKPKHYLDESDYQVYLECQRICLSSNEGGSISTETYMGAFYKRMELDKLIQQRDDEQIARARPGDICLMGLPEAADIGGHTSSDGT